ncbi:MAG: YbbR-like domain-containing protein [Myxococcales bacterium]|nr:YbbR-like domain-containing protein [Myxococcales bacterium]
MKALALALAVTLVLIKREDKITELQVAVPVKVSYPDDRVLVSPPVDKVQVKLQGRYADIKGVTAEEQPALEVNLSGFEGEQFVFEPSALKLPPGLEVKDIKPPVMVVAFEPRKQAMVPIVPRVEGEPDPGFKVLRVSVEPNTVVVEGAASAVDKLERVETSLVALTGRSRSIRLPVSLATPPKYVTFVDGSQQYFASVEIEERREARRFPEQPILVRNVPEGTPGYEVSPPTVDVTLEGPVRLLNALDPAALAPYVDVAEARPGKRILKSQRVVIEPPPGLVFQALEPNRVTLLRREPPPPDAGTDGGADAEDAGAPDE